jgi:exonuclease, DNA polymerase III, epsilon subunit family
MIESYVVFDLETTGINPSTDSIIEIGAIKIIKNEVKETFKTYVNPEIKIPERIKELTGITDKMVSGGMANKEAVSKFIEFSEDYILLGHNIGFDYGFVKKSAKNYNISFEKEGLDTLKIARAALAHLESKSLGALCSHYEIEQKTAHRAYEDAFVTKCLYDKLRYEFYNEKKHLFEPTELIFKEKKESLITKIQKGYLNDLLKYHKIELEADINQLTKSEASKRIDYIILNYGRIRGGRR